MTAPEDVTELAARVQAAYDTDGEQGQHYLQELFAEQLEVRHTPPASFDGVVDRSFLIEYQDAGYAAAKATLHDLRLEATVTIEDDWLVVAKTFSGVKDDGSPVRAVSRAQYLVEDGRIVRVNSTGTQVADEFRDAGVRLK